jgi:hypothetical protein
LQQLGAIGDFGLAKDGVMYSRNPGDGSGGKIMQVGCDRNELLEKRFLAAGCRVIKVSDSVAAIDEARHEIFNLSVLVLRGSLINTAETVFNLRDLNPGMEIIVLVDRVRKHTNRFLKQLLDHLIQGTQVLTRRQLQRRLHATGQSAPPGQSV